jgi:chemotaxis protein methyltransferase CheR
MAADPATDMADARELAAIARDRIGLKPSLSAPKIEALLRGLPADRRRSLVRDLMASNGGGRPWHDFVEALLVHETYFFRHPDQLRLLADELLPGLIERRLAAGSRELRVWCAGCSSGEEVYTLALLVQTAIAASAAPTGWDVAIVGTDLSAPTLELARGGSYALLAGLNSFRDVPAFARHHFHAIFSAAETTWSPDAGVRRMTRFVRHNVVSDPPPVAGADLVVCRNTLIYFDEAHTRAALGSLETALRPGGVLLLGPAETVTDSPTLRLVCTDQAVYWTKESPR